MVPKARQHKSETFEAPIKQSGQTFDDAAVKNCSVRRIITTPTLSMIIILGKLILLIRMKIDCTFNGSETLYFLVSHMFDDQTT